MEGCIVLHTPEQIDVEKLNSLESARVCELEMNRSFLTIRAFLLPFGKIRIAVHIFKDKSEVHIAHRYFEVNTDGVFFDKLKFYVSTTPNADQFSWPVTDNFTLDTSKSIVPYLEEFFGHDPAEDKIVRYSQCIWTGEYLEKEKEEEEEEKEEKEEEDELEEKKQKE
ncbi:hypothetical protein PoB_005902500 [Plakobranchus ocellatus]|uniref:Major sperm protein n=1 Tax=Plakobranchus ocellatus TaxID=259542 RepID=A0AAV4CLD0_9GAST|nr:hypothetical protein PoB_005902500 [Plakobranchus ocellatus]